MRLTNYHRGTIVSKALAIFDSAFKEIEAESFVIGEKAYNFFVPDELQVKLGAVPKEYFDTSCYVYVVFNGKKYTLNLKKERIVPKNQSYYGRTHFSYNRNNEKAKEFCAEIEKHQNKKEALEKKRNEFRRSLESKLQNINTLKRLCELWPEGYVYYKHLEEIPSEKNLPALSFAGINETLGITKNTEQT